MAKRDYYPATKILKLRNLIADYFAQDLVRGRRNFEVHHGQA